jgi:hypothetical protein
MTTKQKLLLAGVIFLAVFFRFYQITSMPGGLFPDEAANGLDINLMQQGHLQPFYERGNGREALFFYMEWASTALFGKGQWEFHATSALVGVLAVIIIYFVTYRLFLISDDPDEQKKKNRAINIGLLASFLMAVSTWHVVLSRTAFRANLTPLFGALTLYFLLRIYQAQSFRAKYWFAILTGAAFGLGFYTYIAYRVMAPILFMILAWPLLASIKLGDFKATIAKYWKLFLVFCASFAVFVAWIADYFYHNFDFFIGRSGQVSIFNQTLYLINGQQLTQKLPLFLAPSVFWAVLKAAIVGFFVHGDLNWRQNISGYGFLSPLISPFFGIGLALVSLLGIWYFFAPAKRSTFWKFFLLTGWFWGMLLPELATAEGIPHGLRSAGVIAPTFIITAWALYELVQLLIKFHKKLWTHVMYHYKDPQWQKDQSFIPPRMRLVNFAFKILVVCFCLALTFQTYYLYFVYAANSPEYFYSFRADLTPVSEYLRQNCNKANTYLILDKFSVQTTDYLTSDPKGNFSDPCSVPYIQEDPENSWQLPALHPGEQVVFTQSSIFNTKKFKQYHPEAFLKEELRNQFGATVMAVYEARQSN